MIRKVAILGILGVAVLLGSLWLEHRCQLTLPTPTGPFGVGRSIYDWVGDKRELLVWIWYPAQPAQTGVVVDDYVPAWDKQPPLPIVFRLITRDLSKVHGHSLRGAEVSRNRPSYPVVIMRAGASLEVATYSTLAEDLASHGYIVVGFDAPYRTFNVVFPDGRTIARTTENNPELVSGEEFVRRGNKLLDAWTADIGFVLDRLEQLNASDRSGKFTSTLDLTRVGVFGHSFGGAQAAQFCSADPRCKAGIDIDGALLGSVIQTGIHKPFMFLLSGNGDFSSAAEVRQVKADIQSVYDRLPAGERLQVVIRGANHFTFNDDGALFKSQLIRGILRVIGVLGIDGRRQLAVTAYCVHSFFDAYLKGTTARPPIPSPLYPEIQLLN